MEIYDAIEKKEQKSHVAYLTSDSKNSNVCEKCSTLMLGDPRNQSITWRCPEETCGNTFTEIIKKD